MIDGALMVSLAELHKRSGRDRSTVYRWLKAKGIETHGRGVLLSELQTKWPPMYSALMLGQPQPRCPVPDCGAPLKTECTVCDFSLLHKGA